MRESHQRSLRQIPTIIDSFRHNHVSSVVTNFAGDWSVGATPVPIPNTVVKPYSADGTPIERVAGE